MTDYEKQIALEEYGKLLEENYELKNRIRQLEEELRGKLLRAKEC